MKIMNRLLIPLLLGAIAVAAAYAQEVSVSLDTPIVIKETKITEKQVNSVKVQTVYINLADRAITVQLNGHKEVIHELTEAEYQEFLTQLGPFLRGVVKQKLALVTR